MPRSPCLSFRLPLRLPIGSRTYLAVFVWCAAALAGCATTSNTQQGYRQPATPRLDGNGGYAQQQPPSPPDCPCGHPHQYPVAPPARAHTCSEHAHHYPAHHPTQRPTQYPAPQPAPYPTQRPAPYPTTYPAPTYGNASSHDAGRVRVRGAGSASAPTASSPRPYPSPTVGSGGGQGGSQSGRPQSYPPPSSGSGSGSGSGGRIPVGSRPPASPSPPTTPSPRPQPTAPPQAPPTQPAQPAQPAQPTPQPPAPSPAPTPPTAPPTAPAPQPYPGPEFGQPLRCSVATSSVRAASPFDITGQGFSSTAEVEVGGTRVQVTSQSATRLQAIAPLQGGRVTVRVRGQLASCGVIQVVR